MATPTTPNDVFNAGNIFAGVQISALAPLKVATGAVSTPIDFTKAFLQNRAGAFLSIYIDNSANDASVLVQSDRTGQWVKCPPFSAGWFPFVTGVGGPPQCSVFATPTRAALASVVINVAFSNVALVQGPFSFRDTYDAAMQEVAINASGAGDLTLVAGVASQTVRVHALMLTLNNLANLTFRRAATVLTGPMFTQALVLDYAQTVPWFTTGAGEAFILNLSAAAQVSGRLYYRQSV